MADETSVFGQGDLRAAVASGHITEAQAAAILAVAHDRTRRRGMLPAEDEPFEFFRGFSEIFVSVGLLILLSGIGLLLVWAGGAVFLMVVPAVCAAVAWLWAEYFTLRRRMNLPSMVLVSAFATGLGLSALTVFGQVGLSPRIIVVSAALASAGGLALWYRHFRLPFTMFLLGIAVLVGIYGIFAEADTLLGFPWAGKSILFDLRSSPRMSLATLVSGISAMVAAMWFDMRDPYRLGRHAATAFWLHMLAAPALVNTVAMTLYNIGGTVGMTSTAIALLMIAAFALVIDRRSFLTAGIVYIALVIAWAVRGGGDDSMGGWIFILLILGALITGLGTWWIQLRQSLMRILPDFPGKSRLPPYAGAA